MRRAVVSLVRRAGAQTASRGTAPGSTLLACAAPYTRTAPAMSAMAWTPSCGIAGVGSLRPFSASVLARSEVAQALSNEHKHELENYEPSEAVEGGPPAPFKLTDEPGSCKLVLSRTFNKVETVTVTVDSQDLEDLADGAEEFTQDAEAEEPAMQLSFSVVVTRSDRPGSLTFYCHSHEEDDMFDITDVALTEDLKLADSEDEFAGPPYETLDNTVLDGFHAYLKERGVNKHMVEYLQELALDKEQREYTRWLERVRNFVAGK